MLFRGFLANYDTQSILVFCKNPIKHLEKPFDPANFCEASTLLPKIFETPQEAKKVWSTKSFRKFISLRDAIYQKIEDIEFCHLV